jgi:DNA-binding transcriptional ArsR family regulator
MVMHLNAFETLADPTRRRIVTALREGERQVGDIVRDAGIHQSGVSRHLKILHEAGFVSVRPDGQRRLYALRPEPFRELDAWLADYRQLWEDRLDRFGAALEQRQKNRTTPTEEQDR